MVYKIINLKIKKSHKQNLLNLFYGKLMEKILMILLLPFLFAGVLQAQNEEKKITFIVKPDVQPVDTSIFITGNHAAVGNWNPSAIPMTKQNDGTWRIEIQIQKGFKLEYKFTKGSWGAEAVYNNGTVPPNHIVTVEEDTAVEIKIENWKDSFQKTAKLQITGRVKYIKNIEFEGISKRDIIIWLPPSYDKNKKKKYPVLYMHDGQNIIDPLTSTFGTDWQVDETADSLIRQNRMKEIIIVGIYNTRNRTSEYSHNDTGRAYMNFIVKKLKPMIDSEYRTLSDRKNTAVMGSSMGGLISLMLAWEHPDVFSMAGCLSPAFKIDRFNYLPYIENFKGKKKKIKLYIDNGGVGLEKRLQPGITETIELLNKKGYRTGKEIMWYLDENAEHNEAAWASRVWRALLFMFGK